MCFKERFISISTTSPPGRPLAQRALVCCVQGATVLTFFYLYGIQTLPPPIYGALGCGDKDSLCQQLLLAPDVRQVLLLSILSSLLALLAALHYAGCPHGCASIFARIPLTVATALINVLPIAFWVLVAIVLILRGDCAGTRMGDPGEHCENYWSIIFDTVGLITARLANPNPN